MSEPTIQATPNPEPAPLLAADLSASRMPTFTSILPFTLAFLAFHALLCCGLAALMLFYVPGAERVFRDFNMKLPTLTEWLLVTAAWFARYWYVLTVWFLLWLVLAGVLLAVFRQRSRVLGFLWALLLLLLPLLAAALVFFAVLAPLLKLREGLSK